MHDLEPSALAIRPLYTSQEYKRVRENATEHSVMNYIIPLKANNLYVAVLLSRTHSLK